VKVQALSDRHLFEVKVRTLETELCENEAKLASITAALDRANQDATGLLVRATGTAEQYSGIIAQLRRNNSAQSPARNPSRCQAEATGYLALRSRRPYVYVIIDGDANHFLPSFLKAGSRGGEFAAASLKREVSAFVKQRKHIPQSCSVKVQLFMNREGFVDTVNRYEKIEKHVINQCLDRFFQSQPTWDLVDTGCLRESADTKIKGAFLLEHSPKSLDLTEDPSKLQILRR
jgi:hypothetical protein